MAQTDLDASFRVITSLVPPKLQHPKIGIICGSGLSGLVESLREQVLIEYDKIPGFVRSTVPGHRSTLAFGLMGSDAGVPVVAMLGRFHPYEGHKLSDVVYPVRVMAKLGVEDIFITNAAGALNPQFQVGTIVAIHDHIALPNLTGPLNPLLGPQSNPSLPRFIPLSNAYTRRLRKLTFHAAHKLQLPSDALAEGTYAWVSGPTYETPAEGRFLRAAGADVVGMSTIPEVVAAKEEGLGVLVLSLVTNKVVIEEYSSVREEVEAEIAGKPIKKVAMKEVSHEEVLALGKLKADTMKSLVEEIVKLYEFEKTS